MKKFAAIIAFFCVLNVSAQQRFDWLKLNRFRVSSLSDSLKENSGLEFFNGRLFTLNDSGNDPDIFEIDETSGKIKKVFPTNIKNVDWEALAADSTSLYIADFGNNEGSRKDLAIYKIPFADSLALNSVQKIPFFYPEQQDFFSKPLNNNFDAEAMFFFSGKLHIFTKEWQSKATTHYLVDPEKIENQAAQKSETFNIGFTVTDAAYFAGKLYLVGYTKKTEVFLSIFSETEPGVFFSKKPQTYYLGSALKIGQIEGLAVDEKGIFLAGEELIFSIIKAKQYLYFVPHEKIK